MPETEGGRGGYTREQYFQDAFDDYVAKKLKDQTWKQSAEVWVTPVYKDLASVANILSDLQGQWHDLILGEPVQSVVGLMPLADIATELTLPGDAAFMGTKRLVQVTGIVVGLASGQRLLANARLKSLVQDFSPEVVSTEIDNFLTNMLEPLVSQERDFEVYPQARNELARHEAEFEELLVAAQQS